MSDFITITKREKDNIQRDKQRIRRDKQSIRRDKQSIRRDTQSIRRDENLLNNIILRENNVIKRQIKNVDETISSQSRVIKMNENYNKKIAAYTKAVLAIVFASAIAMILNTLKSKFGIIPDAVITISYIILFSSSLIYSMFVWSDINSRDKMDFDKLDLDAPYGVLKNSNTVSSGSKGFGNLDLLPGFCIGKDCCTTAMAWDDNNNKCVNSCPTAGYYINETTHECTKCGAGTFSGVGNAEYSCTACDAGTYSSEGSLKCQPKCPANTYADNDKNTCIKCPMSTPFANVGSTNLSDCKNSQQ
jgi:hypothetical protein